MGMAFNSKRLFKGCEAELEAEDKQVRDGGMEGSECEGHGWLYDTVSMQPEIKILKK